MACRSTAYPFPEIERKWQQHWQDNKTFATPHFSQLDKSKPKFYVLDMFPYPRWVGVVVVGVGERCPLPRAAK